MYMLPLATANAVGVLVGQAIGAREFRLARSTAITGFGIALGIAVVSAASLVLAAHRVAGVYTTDGAVRALAASLFVLVAGYHVFDALQAVTVNALRGYKRAVVPLVVNATGMWVIGLGGGVAVGLGSFALPVLGLQGPLGVRGFWIGAMVGMAIATVGIAAYFLRVSAQNIARRGTETVPAA
jgi:MATE family multidrug resistance protein